MWQIPRYEAQLIFHTPGSRTYFFIYRSHFLRRPRRGQIQHKNQVSSDASHSIEIKRAEKTSYIYVYYATSSNCPCFMKLKLTLILFVSFFLNSRSVIAQSKEVIFLIDTCLQIMKENAAHTKNVNWPKLRRTAFMKAKSITDVYQLGPVIRYLYQSLNDFHGGFYYNDSTFKWQRNEQPVSDSIMNEWKKGVSIRSTLLHNNIGYLRVPYMAFGGKEGDSKNAQMLNDSLCSLLDKKIKGLVLDLRLNGGGSMYPMILGLDQLLIPGEIGHFVSKKRISWYLKDNSFLLDTAVLASITPKCMVNAQGIPVVVLIGRGTGSSGEFLAMALKGRKKTLFLGTETSGYVTAIEGFRINQVATVLLSTGYGADRQGRVYKNALQPDVHLKSIDKFNNVTLDEKVQTAMKWIQQHAN